MAQDSYLGKMGVLKAISLVLIFGAGSVYAEMPRNLKAKEDAKYDCVIPNMLGDKVSNGMEMARHKYDKNIMACAADTLFQASKQAPQDIELAVSALAVSADYIDQIATLKNADLNGLQEAEWTIRLTHASNQAKALIERLEKIAPERSDITALKGISVVAIHQFDNPATALVAIRESIGLLKQATQQDPMVLNGEALVILGRMYYEIPTLFGGDVDKAHKLYQQAYEQAPKNIQLLRFLAEYWDGEMEDEKAMQFLAEMLPLEPQFEELQKYADELRIGGGLAERLGDEYLYKQLKQKRSDLFKVNPKLNARKSIAASGHGGVDPLTGEAQY